MTILTHQGNGMGTEHVCVWPGAWGQTAFPVRVGRRSTALEAGRQHPCPAHPGWASNSWLPACRMLCDRLCCLMCWVVITPGWQV